LRWSSTFQRLPGSVKIAAGAFADIGTHAREADPLECCGLLLGTGAAVSVCVRAHNRAVQPDRRYEIDPHDHFAAIRLARAWGLEVVGAYHSHPRSPPVPSAADLAEAFEDFVFVIAGREDQRGESPSDSFVVRAWRFSSGNFAELALVCDA
jgi:desampylase